MIYLLCSVYDTGEVIIAKKTRRKIDAQTWVASDGERNAGIAARFVVVEK